MHPFFIEQAAKHHMMEMEREAANLRLIAQARVQTAKVLPGYTIQARQENYFWPGIMSLLPRTILRFMGSM